MTGSAGRDDPAESECLLGRAEPLDDKAIGATGLRPDHLSEVLSEVSPSEGATPASDADRPDGSDDLPERRHFFLYLLLLLHGANTSA